MTCMCDNSCLLKGKDPKEQGKQMPAWAPIEGYLQKHSKRPPLCALSAINQGAVSGILEWRCYQRCPVYTHTTVSLISAEITDPLQQRKARTRHTHTRLLHLSISLSCSLSQLCYRPLNFRQGLLGKKQSICSGSCLKFNKCVSYIATVWC